MVYTTLIPVICGSGDINAFPSSTMSDFSVELADALMLDGQWQCRLNSVTMPNVNYNAGAGVTSNSIIVTLPGILDGSIICRHIGSTKLPLLYRTGPMLETNTAQRYVYVQDQSPLRDLAGRAAQHFEYAARDVLADQRCRPSEDGPDGTDR